MSTRLIRNFETIFINQEAGTQSATLTSIVEIHNRTSRVIVILQRHNGYLFETIGVKNKEFCLFNLSFLEQLELISVMLNVLELLLFLLKLARLLLGLLLLFLFFHLVPLIFGLLLLTPTHLAKKSPYHPANL